MESNDQNPKRKMYEPEYETAGLAPAADLNKEPDPQPWLKDVRPTYDEKGRNRQSLNRCFPFVFLGAPEISVATQNR